MQATGELKSLAARGAFWGLARFGGEQIFRFIVFATLARLLGPADFGLFALATLFVDIGRIVAFSGLSESLIRAETVDEALLETLFWFAIGRAVVVFAALAALSVPAAALLGQPRVAPVIVALGASLLLEALTNLHSARGARAFRNRSLTVIALLCNFSGGAATVIAASWGFGLWSFVINQLVYGLLGVALLWSVFPWVPKFRGFSRHRLREIIRFSGSIMVAQLLFVVGARAQDLAAGRVLGPADLGQLRVGSRVFDMMYQTMIAPLASVALPTLARLRDDRRAFNQAFLRMASLSALITCPAMLGFAAVGADAVPLLFGDQWRAAVPLMRILSLVAPLWVLGAFGLPTLMALGQGATVMRYSVLQLITVLAASFFAVRYGLQALAAALVVRTYLLLPVQLWLFKRASGLSPQDVIRSLAPPMGAAILMAAALLGLDASIRAAIDAPWARLAATVPLGVLIYALALGLLWRGFVRRQIDAIRSVLPRR